MGWIIGRGNSFIFRQGGGNKWSSYWTNQSEVLFFGLYSEISGGRMPNKVTGATDYLTVAGSAGSETYQCPNTAAYIAADNEHIWFYSDDTQRTTTTAELIGYDFTRTIVKYANTTPYAIEAIMILSSDVDTAKMRDDFDLSIWWSNILSAHGNLKGNRGVGRSVWNPNAVWCDEYNTVLAAMATEPSQADKTIQNTMLKALVDGGYFAKAEFLDLFATHSENTSLLNWHNPGTFNPSTVGSPTWTQYKSYLGANGKYVRLNYVPSINKINITQDNICYIVGCQAAPAGTYLFGGQKGTYLGGTMIGTNASTNRRNYFLNSQTLVQWLPFTDTKGHFGMSRTTADTILPVFNQTDTSKAQTSDLLCDVELHACGYNLAGVHQTSLAELSYVFCFSYLTAAEQKAVIAIMETYLDNYGIGLY